MRFRRTTGDADTTRIDELLAHAGDTVAPPDDDELRALARAAALTARTAPRRRPLGLRGALASAAALLVGSALGFGLSAWRTDDVTAGTTVAGVGFLPAKGWSVAQADAAGPAAATAVAANVPLHPDDPPSAVPVATLESLRAGGVVVTAEFALRGDPSTEHLFPLRSLPLRFEDAETVPAGADPLPAADLGRYRLRAAVGAYNVDAAIYFGGGVSSAAAAAAQRQLNRLFVAAEPVTLAARETEMRRTQTFVNLFGSVASDKAEETVQIQGKECGPHAPSYRTWGLPVYTREGGGWSATAHILATTSYRAVWRGNVSPAVTVWARPWVTLRRQSTRRWEVRVSGYANFWRKRVQIQTQDPRVGRWTTVRTVVLNSSSQVNFRMTLPRGKLLRAVLPLAQARPCYLAGFSRILRT